MGTNNLKTAYQNTKILDSDLNQFKTALSGDFVPRNKQGIPITDFSSLGKSSARWASINLKEFSLGNGVNLKDVSGNLSIEINNTQVSTFDTGISLNDFADFSTPNRAFEIKHLNDSDVYSQSYVGATAETVLNSSITIESIGRILLIGITGNNVESYVAFQNSTVSVSSYPRLRVLRSPGAVEVYSNFNTGYSYTASTSHNQKIFLPPCFFTLDAPSSGSRTYSLQMASGATSTVFVEGLSFYIIEL